MRFAASKHGFDTNQAQLQLTASPVGYLIDDAILPSGERVSVTGWTRPVAEPELAVYLNRDTREQLVCRLGSTSVAATVECGAIGPASRGQSEQGGWQ